MKDSTDFASLLEAFEQEHKGAAPRGTVRIGDKVRGRVLSIGEEQIFVDLGGKAEGILDAAAWRATGDGAEVAIGDEIEAVVTRIDEETGAWLLGAQQAQSVRDAADLEQAYRQRQTVEGQVTGAIKGGLEIQIAGHRAFCPASQIDLRFVEDLSEFVGQRLAFRLTKFEGGRRPNLVVSRRVLLEEEQQARAEAVRARLEEGAVLNGVVTALKDYGAFVDLGGLEGMIHISQMAFHRIRHPSELLSVGQPIEVAVLRVERTGDSKRPEKIALSIRALAQDPWSEAGRRFAAGTRVPGRVTRLQAFGAFVELAPGIEGLVHISELGAERRIGHPQEVLSPGQEVEVQVLEVDLEKRRLRLSLDADRGIPAAEAAAHGAPPEDRGGLGSFGALLKKTLDQAK